MDKEFLEQISTNADFFEFIERNINTDTNSLRLKSFKDKTFDVNFAITQIDCKNRIKKKLPEIFKNKSFLFPHSLSTEQCTAEAIAKFHSSLFNSNDTVLDLTAGLCIDTYYISRCVKHVTAIEIDKITAVVSAFNMSKLTNNVSVLNCDCTVYVKKCKNTYDAIFIDPARRGLNNKRLYSLSDCLPNIIELHEQLTKIAPILYIKASPMIDITLSIKDLKNKISDIWVIGINNECKELLIKANLHTNEVQSPNIHTINFCNNGEIQRLESCNDDIENNLNFRLPQIQDYIYEPNSCIMKAQIYKTLASKFKVSSLHQNSHLFLSNENLTDFPGRKFKITNIIPFKNKEIKEINKLYPKINISVRNFKLSADELKKRLKVSDGGDIYLFGTTDKNDNAILIICNKA